METLLPLRLPPGADLRRTLEEAANAAFVVSGIGSLVEVHIRYAGAATEIRIEGPLEILSLAGSLSASGAHLHISVSDASGRVYGGHLGYGSRIRTTAELLLAPLDAWSLTREHDASTGFKELVISLRQSPSKS